jgi:hypothetical protein
MRWSTGCCDHVATCSTTGLAALLTPYTHRCVSRLALTGICRCAATKRPRDSRNGIARCHLTVYKLAPDKGGPHVIQERLHVIQSRKRRVFAFRSNFDARDLFEWRPENMKLANLWGRKNQNTGVWRRSPDSPGGDLNKGLFEIGPRWSQQPPTENHQHTHARGGDQIRNKHKGRRQTQVPKVVRHDCARYQRRAPKAPRVRKRPRPPRHLRLRKPVFHDAPYSSSKSPR